MNGLAMMEAHGSSRQEAGERLEQVPRRDCDTLFQSLQVMGIKVSLGHQTPVVAAGDDLQAAVFRIHILQGDSGGQHLRGAMHCP